MGSRQAGKHSATPSLRTRVFANPLRAGCCLLLQQLLVLPQVVRLEQLPALLKHCLNCRTAALVHLLGQQCLQQRMLVLVLFRCKHRRLLRRLLLRSAAGATLH